MQRDLEVGAEGARLIGARGIRDDGLEQAGVHVALDEDDRARCRRPGGVPDGAVDSRRPGQRHVEALLAVHPAREAEPLARVAVAIDRVLRGQEPALRVHCGGQLVHPLRAHRERRLRGHERLPVDVVSDREAGVEQRLPGGGVAYAEPDYADAGELDDDFRRRRAGGDRETSVFVEDRRPAVLEGRGEALGEHREHVLPRPQRSEAEPSLGVTDLESSLGRERLGERLAPKGRARIEAIRVGERVADGGPGSSSPGARQGRRRPDPGGRPPGQPVDARLGGDPHGLVDGAREARLLYGDREETLRATRRRERESAGGVGRGGKLRAGREVEGADSGLRDGRVRRLLEDEPGERLRAFRDRSGRVGSRGRFRAAGGRRGPLDLRHRRRRRRASRTGPIAPKSDDEDGREQNRGSEGERSPHAASIHHDRRPRRRPVTRATASPLMLTQAHVSSRNRIDGRATCIRCVVCRRRWGSFLGRGGCSASFRGGPSGR